MLCIRMPAARDVLHAGGWISTLSHRRLELGLGFGWLELVDKKDRRDYIGVI